MRQQIHCTVFLYKWAIWKHGFIFFNIIHLDCTLKVNFENSISKTHPQILKYISKYNEVDPNTITYGTGKKLRFLINSREYYDTPRNFNRILNRLNGNWKTSVL